MRDAMDSGYIVLMFHWKVEAAATLSFYLSLENVTNIFLWS